MQASRRHMKTQTKGERKDNEKRANKQANLLYFSENRFRSGGEENERKMANNIMQEMRVYDGYWVGLMMQTSPATAPEILPTACKLRWDFPEEERMMQYSRDK